MSTIPELKFMPGTEVRVKLTGALGKVLGGYYSEVRQVTTYTVKTHDGAKVTVLEDQLEKFNHGPRPGG